MSSIERGAASYIPVLAGRRPVPGWTVDTAWRPPGPCWSRCSRCPASTPRTGASARGRDWPTSPPPTSGDQLSAVICQLSVSRCWEHEADTSLEADYCASLIQGLCPHLSCNLPPLSCTWPRRGCVWPAVPAGAVRPGAAPAAPHHGDQGPPGGGQCTMFCRTQRETYRLELQTKVREDFTITEKARTRVYSWL